VDSQVKLFYVDDSGSEKSGLAVLGWIELDILDWSSTLERVLDWRRGLAEAHGIPKSHELHAVKFVNGRGSPGSDEQWNRVKRYRQEIAQDFFGNMATWPGVTIRGLTRKTNERRHGYQRAREAAYTHFVTYAEASLQQTGAHGVVFIDGDGTQSMYRRAHRRLNLATRRIVEDPAFQHSHGSHLIQVADFVAYALFQREVQNPAKDFSWDWFDAANGELVE
jgi:hypothetical protein